MSLIVEVTEKGVGRACVALTGKLDTQTAPACAGKIGALLDRQVQALILDMSGVSFISSMGIRVILNARKKVEAYGGVLTMTSLQPQVQKVFDIVEVLPRENIFENMEEADRYFAAMQQQVLDGRK